MRLHTKTSPTNVGLLSKKVAWLFDCQLQLTPEETALITKYQYGDYTIGTINFEKSETYVPLHQVAAGKKGMCFQGLGPLTQFENSLIPWRTPGSLRTSTDLNLTPSSEST